MGETERAWEIFDLLNPVNHGSSANDADIYKVEPYGVVADVYSAKQHPGRGGWSWYTGSSAWLYRLLTEMLFGINRRGEKLEFTPRMRKEWDQYTVRYRYYDTVYHIIFKRITDASAPKLVLDNTELTDNRFISLVNDQMEHTVEIWVR